MTRSLCFLDADQSKEPGEKLRGEKCESPTKHNPGNLPFGPRFAVHEEKSTNYDRDQRQRPGERARKCQGQVVRGALPRRLREGNRRKGKQRRERQGAEAPTEREARAGE